RVSTTITLAGDVGQDDLGALPVPYPATTVTASGTLGADRSTLMVFDPDVSLGGLKETVPIPPDPPPRHLPGAAPAPPADIAAHYLSVPSSYDSLKDLA